MTWKELKAAMERSEVKDDDSVHLSVDGDEHEIRCVRVALDCSGTDQHRQDRCLIVAKPDF